MVEPSYELASAEAREANGSTRICACVCRNLMERLGHPARLVERWPHNANPLNKAALIVVDKAPAGAQNEPRFVSPISGRDLVERKDCWYLPRGRSRISDHCWNSVSDDGQRRAGEQARSVLNKWAECRKVSLGSSRPITTNGEDSMMQALQNFVGEPLRHRRFDLAWYRLSQLLHDRTNGGYDAVYMRLARIFRPKVLLPELPQAQRDEIKGRRRSSSP